jgi:hypothetical protein
MKTLDTSINAGVSKARTQKAPEADLFSSVMSFALLGAIVLVCALIVAIPTLTVVLR